MITLIVVLYFAVAVFALPKITRGLAKSLVEVGDAPLDMVEQFMVFIFGVVLTAVWPIPALFFAVRDKLFGKEVG